MIKIYKLFDDIGNIYVGSTTRKLSIRMSEHKSNKLYNMNYNTCNIELLEECSSELRYDRENYWMSKFKCINKAIASKGPIGFKNNEKELKRKSEQMKKFHLERPDIIKKARENSLTSEKQKIRNLKANKLRIEKMQKYIAIDKKTNEKTIDYELETIILEEKKVTKHTRNHLGFLGVELYDTIKQHGFDTNQIGFLSIDNENGLNFDKKGNPIIENNRPKGKITIKTGEMMPILFNAIFELNKIVDDLKKEIQVLKEK